MSKTTQSAADKAEVAAQAAPSEKTSADYVAEAATAMERIAALEQRVATHDQMFRIAFGRTWMDQVTTTPE